MGARVRRGPRRSPATATAFAQLLRRARRAVRGRSPHAIVPASATRASCTARWPRCARCPQGCTLLWATTASRDYPVWFGAGAATRAPWPAAGRRFVRDRRDRGARCTAASRAPPRRRSRSRRARQHKTLATAERVWTRLVQAGATRARPRRRRRRRRRRRPRRVLRGDLPARRPGRPRPDDDRRPGRLGLRRQDGRRPAARPRTTSAPTTSRPACSSTPACSRRCPRAERAAGYAEVVKTALIAGGPLWDARRRRRRASTSRSCARARARSCASSPPTSATPACARCSTSATPSATRSRRSTGYAPLPPRRGGRRSGCSRRCGSPARTRCARRSRSCSRRPACRRGSTASTREAVAAATARDKKRLGGRGAVRARRARRATCATATPSTPTTLRAAVRELAA